MTYLIPTINPIIYAFSNESFQLSISNLCPSLCIGSNHSNFPTTQLNQMSRRSSSRQPVKNNIESQRLFANNGDAFQLQENKCQ